MQEKEVRLSDGRTLEGATWDGGVCWVPEKALRFFEGVHTRRLDDGRRALCREELCAPLDDGHWRGGDGAVSLEGLCAALDLEAVDAGGAWRLQPRLPAGLGVGMRPPDFVLPQLNGGAERSPAHYHGRRAVFYMWASW